MYIRRAITNCFSKAPGPKGMAVTALHGVQLRGLQDSNIPRPQCSWDENGKYSSNEDPSSQFHKETQMWFPHSLMGLCCGHGNGVSILNIAEVPGHTCRSQALPLVFSALHFQELGTFCISQSAARRRKPIQNTN